MMPKERSLETMLSGEPYFFSRKVELLRQTAVAENPSLTDSVWLGCRLSPTGVRLERFRGEIDELFIADRGLEPQEIVSLMNDNRLPSTALAPK